MMMINGDKNISQHVFKAEAEIVQYIILNSGLKGKASIKWRLLRRTQSCFVKVFCIWIAMSHIFWIFQEARLALTIRQTFYRTSTLLLIISTSADAFATNCQFGFFSYPRKFPPSVCRIACGALELESAKRKQFFLTAKVFCNLHLQDFPLESSSLTFSIVSHDKDVGYEQFPMEMDIFLTNVG